MANRDTNEVPRSSSKPIPSALKFGYIFFRIFLTLFSLASFVPSIHLLLIEAQKQDWIGQQWIDWYPNSLPRAPILPEIHNLIAAFLLILTNVCGILSVGLSNLIPGIIFTTVYFLNFAFPLNQLGEECENEIGNYLHCTAWPLVGVVLGGGHCNMLFQVNLRRRGRLPRHLLEKIQMVFAAFNWASLVLVLMLLFLHQITNSWWVFIFIPCLVLGFGSTISQYKYYLAFGYFLFTSTIFIMFTFNLLPVEQLCHTDILCFAWPLVAAVFAFSYLIILQAPKRNKRKKKIERLAEEAILEMQRRCQRNSQRHQRSRSYPHVNTSFSDPIRLTINLEPPHDPHFHPGDEFPGTIIRVYHPKKISTLLVEPRITLTSVSEGPDESKSDSTESPK